FDDVELIRVRMAEVVEPCRLVEADDVDDERVAFVVTHRMTEIRRVQRVARRMRTAVHGDLAPDVCRAFEDHQDALLVRQLDDLHRIRRRHQARSAWWQTITSGIVFGVVLRVVVVDSRGPGLKRHPWFALGAASSTATARAFTTTERRSPAR